MQNNYRITVHAHGNNQSGEASALRVYIPLNLRADAAINVGDKFEVRVVNNKVALRKTSHGSVHMNSAGHISIPTTLFEPPLLIHPSMEIKYKIHEDWLCFQVPKEMEKVVEGFGLITARARITGDHGDD